MNIAVIFAGGVGTRMNHSAVPKQFLKLNGKEIIIYTLEKFNECPDIDGISIACIEPWIPYLKKKIKQYEINKVKTVVAGGKTGQESILRALYSAKTYAEKETIVLIHDGVRPLIDSRTIQENIECVKKHGSAVTVTRATETIIQTEKKADERVIQIADRSLCCMARAPQSFFLEEVIEAHEKAIGDGNLSFIDTASLMKYYGKQLFIVEGPCENIKITTPADYYAFKAYCEAEEDSQVFGI